MAKTKRSAEKEAYWRSILQKFAAGTESVRNFCDRMKISEQSFYSWRREIANRDREVGGTSLMPVEVVDAVDEGEAGSRAIEITRGGWTVRFGDQVDSHRLREVLGAIESLRSATSC